MSTCGTFSTVKDPQADKDYRIQWGDWLEEGDTITDSSWEAQAGSGITLHDDSIDGTDAVVWVEGGVVSDVKWRVTNTITTADGRVDERSIMFEMKDL